MIFLRHFLLAVQFFTRVPVSGALARWVGYSPEMLRKSAAHFPGVGLMVGVVAAAVYSACALLLSNTAFTPLAAAAISTVVSVLMTGAFHEDGLADVADGLGGSANRERALDIMKDSRIGAFGSLALVLVLITKVSLLAVIGSVDWTLAAAGLVAAHSVSRALPLLLIRALPHVGDTATSKSKPLAEQISDGALFVAAAWSLLAVVVACQALDAVDIGAGVGASLIGFLWMWRLFARRLQGFTGDCLGATQQVCEVAFYLGLAVTA